MINLLKSKKLRATPFRLEVLGLFEKTTNALDLSTIESELKDFDRVTLYRTIKIFIEYGILHEILISGEVKKFALCSDGCETKSHKHDHIHFLCTICNEVFCLEPIKMPSISHDSFEITSVEVQAKGICSNCKDLS
ncbi:MAG: Fur family ferric uptake transcriptional regulator [Arenicella sp.]|jgi:Fur family ferric uptake transcriptional regulator